MILTEKHQKYQDYAKMDKYKYLTDEVILPLNKRQVIEQSKFAYSPLGRYLEKQTEKKLGAIDSLKLSNEKDELK